MRYDAAEDAHTGRGTEQEAKQLAAVLLDVLAGSRSPLQAAESLGLSLPRYYQMDLT